MEPGEYALMDAAEAGMWWYRALHARMADTLAGTRGRVLDAGCGTGGLLARLRGLPGIELHGLEYDASAAARAAAKSGAIIARGSINALPYADASFAAVLSADVLCHAAVDPPTALAELRRVLVPGGLLVLNMPSYQWPMTPRVTTRGAPPLAPWPASCPPPGSHGCGRATGTGCCCR
jgi:SAM-dependent methyltransferase